MQIGWTAVAMVALQLAAGIACLALGQVEVGVVLLLGSGTTAAVSYARPAVSRSLPPPPPGGDR